MTTYTTEMGIRICRLIAEGHSVRGISGKDGLPCQDTVYHWIFMVPEFHEHYVKARQMQAELYAERINERAQETLGLLEKCKDPKIANAIVQAVKLEIDSFKWTAAKLLPGKYGDKLSVEHTVDESLAKRLEKAEMQLASITAPKLIDARS